MCTQNYLSSYLLTACKTPQERLLNSNSLLQNWLSVNTIISFRRTMHLLKSIICCFIIPFFLPCICNANHSWFAAVVLTSLKFIANYTKIINTCIFLHTYVQKNQYCHLKCLEKILQLSRQFRRSITTLISLYGIFMIL